MNTLYCFGTKFTIIKRLSEFEGSYGEIYVIEGNLEGADIEGADIEGNIEGGNLEGGNLEANQRYLAKIAKNTPEASLSLRNEYNILQYLGEKSPYIIKTYCYEENKDYCILILEYAKHGDLHTLLSRKKLSEKNAVKMFRQILKAIAYCHSKGVFHRDLKTENIVIGEKHSRSASRSSSRSSSFVCKIIDFGIAKIGEPCTGVKGTDGFIPYEAQHHTKYDCAKADVYALGMIFVLLMTRREFFDVKKSERKVKEYIINPQKYWQTTFSTTILEKYREVVDGMIDVDPKKRWTIEHVQKWFKKLN
jgi:serine/threonine protein kinase